MCGKRIKIGLFTALLLCCLLVPGTGYAQTITEEQLNSYDQNLNRLQQIIDSSKNLTSNSQTLILSLQQKLDLALQHSQKADSLVVQSATIIEQQKQTILKQEKSLQDSKALIKKLENKNSSIGLYGSTESFGVFATHDSVIVFGGPKYNGGVEVGAGFQVRF